MRFNAQLLTAGCFAVLQTLSLATPVPDYFQAEQFSRRDLSVETVKRELGPKLSKGSLIFGPEDPLFANATERWQTRTVAKIQVVVQPAKEDDISTIVGEACCCFWPIFLLTDV